MSFTPSLQNLVFFILLTKRKKMCSLIEKTFLFSIISQTDLMFRPRISGKLRWRKFKIFLLVFKIVLKRMAFLWCLIYKCLNITNFHYSKLTSNRYFIRNRQKLSWKTWPLWELNLNTRGNRGIMTRVMVQFHLRTKVEMPTLGSHYRDTTTTYIS